MDYNHHQFTYTCVTDYVFSSTATQPGLYVYRIIDEFGDEDTDHVYD